MPVGLNASMLLPLLLSAAVRTYSNPDYRAQVCVCVLNLPQIISHACTA